MDTSGQKWAMHAQCFVSCALGCAAWVFYPETTNSFERYLAALLAGFGGTYALTFCWVWMRYGWRAARSMTMEP